MGGCVTKCPVPMVNDPDAPVGQVYPIPNACADVASVPRDLCPKNGEWEGVSAGGCQYASNNNGCEINCQRCCCSGGACRITGARTGCRRTRYSADKTQCCLQGVAMIGDKTCDPRYRNKGSAECKEVLRQYCDDPTNFFNDTCKEWVGNLQDQLMNNLANKHCANSTDDWCACFTATVPSGWEGTTKEALFRCLDTKCEGGKNPKALKPYNLVCPTSYVDCQQNDIRLELEQSGIDKATIQNKCGAIELGPPPPSGGGGSPPPSGGGSGGGGSPPPPTDGGDGESKGLSKTAIWGIGGGAALLILIIIIVVIVAVSRKKKGGK